MDSERDYLYYSVFALVIIALLMFFGLVRNIDHKNHHIKSVSEYEIFDE